VTIRSLPADSRGSLFPIGRYLCRSPRSDSPAGFLRFELSGHQRLGHERRSLPVELAARALVDPLDGSAHSGRNGGLILTDLRSAERKVFWERRVSASHASAILRRVSRSSEATRSSNIRHLLACCLNEDTNPSALRKMMPQTQSADRPNSGTSTLENSNKRCIGPTPTTATMARPTADFSARPTHRELEVVGNRVGAATASSGPGASGASKTSCNSADCARASKDPVPPSNVLFAALGKSLKLGAASAESSTLPPL
jgi:hypothetical protein